MIRRVLGFLAFLLAAAVCAAADMYSTDLDVKPAGETGSYVCQATVTDLATGQKVFAPRVEFRPGAEAAARSGSGSPAFELTVQVDSKTDTATALLRVTRDGKLVASNRATMQIR